MFSSWICSIWSRFCCAAVGLCVLGFTSTATADDPFRERIVPFVNEFCSKCHNADLSEAELNLARYQSAEMAAEDFRQWEHVITFLQREEMPPKSAKQQPSPQLRAEILKTLRTVLDSEARKLAGDPGNVLPRRLSNAEYDHTIRDLTRVDIRPTRSFPVDPAAGEGFDNTGEALAMTPNLFAKLYAAAQHVADHAVLTTKGLEFAPYPVVTLADKTTFYEQAILQFYEQHQIDYAQYLTACWEYRYRPVALKAATLEEWARERHLSAKYLHSLFELLQGDPGADQFYIGWVRGRWNKLPAPVDATTPNITGEVRGLIQRLASDIQGLSKQLCPLEAEAIVANAGNAPIQHLDRRGKTAAERDTFDPKSIQPNRRLSREFRNLDRQAVIRIVITGAEFGHQVQPDAAQAGAGFVIVKSMNFSTAHQSNYQPQDEKRNTSLKKLLTEFAPEQLSRLKFGSHPSGAAVDAETCVLAMPGSLEIEVPTKAFGKEREIRFFVDVELDRTATKLNLLAVSLSEGDGKSDQQPHEFRPNELDSRLIGPDQSAKPDVVLSGKTFCGLFPNRFYFADETRGLSAGFHLIEGVFRDDQPLCKLVLNDEENRELNRLWTELEFVTEITEKMLRGFVFFERSERNFIKHEDFDSFKEDDPKLVEPETLVRFERLYLNHANFKAPIEELTTNPIHIFFERLRNGLKLRHDQLRQAEPIYLKNIEAFAQAAYRRPLSAKELDDLRTFFRETADQAVQKGTDQSQKDQGVEQAVRASLVRILVSPYFGCRIDPSPVGKTVQPLDDLTLASRLSYFLWSSMPDAELRGLAEAGKLHDEQVLLSQTRRMLKDAKVTDFSREFFGQWLGYRDFPHRESVDRNVFKDFDEPLKQAMFEEPTRLATYLIQNDLPATKLLDSDMTFVDQRLASHYGLPFTGPKDEWKLVDGLQSHGRGGILGMAVFLTKNSQPQRTSPVKRGFWVVHKVLGEHIPAPPADVVALPAKETDTNGKTIRELLALHVDAPKCARCHVRFDAVGLSMEGFDPIGRVRTKDLAGRQVDNAVRLSDGTEVHGVPEFARQLVKERHGDFVQTLCRKLLGYALGRSLQLSDEVLLHEMRLALDQNGDRFIPLFETIVRSPQFRNQRCRDFATADFRIQNQANSR
ncbi:MAG: cytochrome [Planctomycetaceae bacterium]|nr:cytochrome [Planctomycetaceae bacterium]